MRQDQYERLQARIEKLTEVLIDETDTDSWPGAKIPIDKQDSKIRGDRYWFKKNAVATCATIIRMTTLVGQVQRATANGKTGAEGAVVEEPEGLDAEIRAAEKEADAWLKKMKDPGRKVEFDKRVHGKT